MTDRVIGVDIGGTKILALELNSDDGMGAEVKAPTPFGGEAVLDAAADVIRRLGAVDKVGVGAPGLVDRDGVLRFAPNLPHVVGLPVKAGLEKGCPAPTLSSTTTPPAPPGPSGSSAPAREAATC